ncbi:hypothetical protein [Tuberibacillus calidus]|uniref:hypothetical protein n=1 Tax=Tuberibacillus calidus TaxID=340097 RepID=UPI00040AC35A|nr:hypothetical protein [Tuberibacillus calidus]
MGLFQAISNWQTERYQRHVSRMQALDKCPDCRGRGFINVLSFDYAMPYECPGCNGSGSYSDWENSRD